MVGHHRKLGRPRALRRRVSVPLQLMDGLKNVPGVGLAEHLDRDVNLSANGKLQADQGLQSTRPGLVAKWDFLLRRHHFSARHGDKLIDEGRQQC